MDEKGTPKINVEEVVRYGNPGRRYAYPISITAAKSRGIDAAPPSGLQLPPGTRAVAAKLVTIVLETDGDRDQMYYEIATHQIQPAPLPLHAQLLQHLVDMLALTQDVTDEVQVDDVVVEDATT